MALTKIGKEGITGISNSSDATALTIADTETVAIGGTTITDLNLLNLIGNTGSRNVGITFNKTNSTAQIWGMQNVGDLVIYNYTDSFQAMNIDEIGAVTIPKQPAFLVKPSSIQTNLTVGAFTTVVFGTEIFDQNSDFASNVFTAPVTGRYQFNVEILLQAVNNAYEYIDVQLITSNRNYINDMTPDHFMNTDSTLHMGINVLADMDAGDTAYVRIAVPNAGSAQTDVHTYSSFSGYLVA